MSVSASMVKELRDRTGAGMMDCKNALLQSGGDMEMAVELLRKSGQAKADRKSARIAAEGGIAIACEANRAVILEINSETDFVAKDRNFIEFAESVADAALSGNPADVDALLMETLDDGRSVETARTELVSKMGENISVRRFARLDTEDQLGAYSHGARIGVVVALSGGDAELAKNVAMHIAASNPLCVDPEQVPKETLEKERRILTEQARESGKRPEIVEKMVAGRVAKYLKDITLLGQAYVRDPDRSVADLLAEAGAQVTGFVRYEVGEGIEKRREDFAAEVMAQVKQSR